MNNPTYPTISHKEVADLTFSATRSNRKKKSTTPKRTSPSDGPLFDDLDLEWV